MDAFLDASAWVLPVLLAVILHEIAHGWMAEKFGDDTARRMGRITLNPISHIDLRGTITFPALLWLLHSPIIFGSAKPVPVNFGRLRPFRLGMIVVALAGPGTNLLLALITGLLLHIEVFITPEQAPWLFMNLYRCLMLNCVLATFNLLPILPLDGGRVVYALLRGKAQLVYGRFERFGIVLLIATLVVPTLLGYDGVQQALLIAPSWLLETVMTVTGNNQ